MSFVPIPRGLPLTREAPDPRARAVVEASPARRRNEWILALECGHVERRRFLCRPSRVICQQCPRPAGGIQFRR